MWTRGIQRKGWEDAGPSGLFIGWEKAASVRAKRVVQWVGRHSKCVGQAGCSVGGWEDTASVRAKRVVQWVGRSSKRLGQAGCSVGGEMQQLCGQGVSNVRGWKTQQACGPSGLFSGWVG